MELSKLSVPKGARKRRKNLGRGEGSGHGKTCGKGGKGQTARSGGKIRAGFEGGQMPLYRRIPKLGFISREQTAGRNQYMTINLGVLERFESGATVDAVSLAAIGYAPRAKERAGIKVLGSGKLTKKLKVCVTAITESARSQIESCGGSVELACEKSADAAR